MEHLHQETKVCIGPSSGEFNPGFQIEGHARFGTEYDTEVAPMSDECKKAAAVFGIKVTLTDEGVGSKAIETLEQLKEMAMGVDQVKEAFDKGLDVSFRHEGASVWINVRVPETMPELQALPGWDKVNLAETQYGGKNDFKVTSGMDPTKFLTATVDEIIEMFTNFSVEAQGNFEELHHVITAATALAKDFLPDKKEVKMAMAAINFLTAFRSMGFEFKYDPTVVRSVIKNVMQSSGKVDNASEMLVGTQGMGNEFLPQAQMMAPMFIGPYVDLLKQINLGHYEVFVMVPRLRLYIRPGFTLFGLNAFLNEKFLSE